jgi:pimeloyl-ACP methyl ester carboxylesterase
MRFMLPLLASLALAGAAQPATLPLGADLERFDYGAPIHWFRSGAVHMAYLDLTPPTPANGTTIVLLHGKNFCAGTWLDTARALAAHGYRVIAPDQVGFCKSSKPAGFQYSVPALATLTRDLLTAAGVERAVLVGHSTGGLIAMRFALLYPGRVSALVLVNPLGLNDTLAEGVPYAPLDKLRAEEAKTDATSIKAYQLKYYYHGEWRPQYDRWVAMLAGQYASPDGNSVREAQARTSEMIEAGPVAAELPRLALPVTLLIGQADRTAFRASSVPPALQPRIRTAPEAAEQAARVIPHARLVRLEGLGHAPFIEAPGRFQAALLDALAGQISAGQVP